MKLKTTGIRRGLDWMTLSLYLCLVVVGWLMIFTVGYEDGFSDIGGFLSAPIGRQTIWIGISFLAMLVLYFIDWKFFQTFAYLFYIIAVALLILVLIFGTKINNATSWFVFGGVSFQPAELAKLATCLALSSYLSSFSTSMRNLNHQFISVGLFLVPFGLILLQPDPGSALVFLSFLVVLYRAGLSATIYIIGTYVTALFILALMYPALNILLALLLIASIILVTNSKKSNNPLFISLALGALAIYISYIGYLEYATIAVGLLFLIFGFLEWQNKKQRLILLLSLGIFAGGILVFSANYAFNNILKKHQQERINVWLNPEKSDPRGASYNLIQSKMAIGSGGLQGKGFLQGVMTKLDYVPEQDTDFIFCTIGEEQGFMGSLSIMILFLWLLYRLITVAERQRSSFSRFYCYGIAGILFVHFFINIGMTMGLVPVIGIPLPFISRGGSSLLIFSLMIGLVLKLDSNRFRI